MRLLLKITLSLIGLYVLFWIGLAVYFSYAERHKGLLEANLESIFKRPVTIQEVKTAWRGTSPVIQINGFEVAGDIAEMPALAFASMSAELAPLSLLQLWPKLTELAVQSPVLEIASLPNNRLQIAGIQLGSNKSGGINARKLISWLINHQAASWVDGEIVWRKPNGDVQRYQEVSFVYERELENRVLSAAALTEQGVLAIKAEANGNMLNDPDWDATVEVLGDQGQRLLSSDDLSLVVEKGQGRLQLRALRVERVRDFLILTGLSEAASWIMDSQLDGSLRNVQFDFSGPFLRFQDWALRASAADISFISTDQTPGMNALSGTINATAEGGVFQFGSDNATFSWPKWFDTDFTIDNASGRFEWEIADSGDITVRFDDARFSDGVVAISSIDATCRISRPNRRVGMLADLFTVDSVEDLSFEGGQVVSNSAESRINLNAKAEFSISDFSKTGAYLPNNPKLSKLKTWWENAFVAGKVTTAKISYDGEVSSSALREGMAQLNGRADFEGVELDYGYQREWPILDRGRGMGLLENNRLMIIPSEAWVAGDQITNSSVTIEPLFERSRALSLQGSMRTSLATVADFLFAGPLLSPEQKALQADEPFPVLIKAGEVDADVEVTIPLNRVKDTRVVGKARVERGRVILPQGVALDNVTTNMKFSERSVSASEITADFLGGNVTAALTTEKVAQPPVLKIAGIGRGQIAKLEPWVGEHLLSWFDGTTEWQGEVGIDGPQVTINVESMLEGVTVSAPAPLAKLAEEPAKLNFSMRTGGKQVKPELVLDYGDNLRVHMSGDEDKSNTLLDRARAVVAENVRSRQVISPPGINFLIDYPKLNLDAWLEAVIDLATLETKPLPEGEEPNTAFLDAMRSLDVTSQSTEFLGRNFGLMEVSAFSADGLDWIGRLKGDHVDGAVLASPRADTPAYRLNMSRFHLIESENDFTPPDPINPKMDPAVYPDISFGATNFTLAGKKLGKLSVSGAAQGDRWVLEQFSLDNTDIRTTGTGYWENNAERGSLTELNITTTIDEAGGVLDEMQFNDLIRKGEGTFKGNLTWIGAPHEFDFARLNGDFDFQINDGELIQVESGAGKLIGLLNFNSILRRLTFDFRDVFSSGLKFDKMQYTGIVAEGRAIMREAFMLSPAVFVQMEGNIDLNLEEIDMEIHASPELGGNLALLSAIANPTAGAVVFLTQRIFKDQMRDTSLLSYRAKGTWSEFELVELDSTGEPISKSGKEKEEVEPVEDGQAKGSVR